MSDNPLDIFETKQVSPPPPKKRKKRSVLLLAFALVFLIIGGVAGLYLVNLWRNFDSGVTRVKIASVEEEKQRPANLGKGENYLLLGSDKRDEEEARLSGVFGQRSDVMMLVHVSADKKSAYVMSFPRDLYVDIPGKGTDRINAALAYGGVPLTVKTVEQYVGVRIDHVALIDFHGITGMVNAIGGVDVSVSKTIEGDGYTFTKGVDHMDGAKALAFVRQRYQYADGDFQRNRNQRELLKAILSKTLKPETLSNPVAINNLVSELSPYLTVDDGLTTSALVSTIFSLRDLRNSSIFYLSVPHGEPMVGKGGASVVGTDEARMDILRKALKEDTMGTYYSQYAGT
ncbi:LCP family protein [Dermabacteraceae bacterium P7074]